MADGRSKTNKSDKNTSFSFRGILNGLREEKAGSGRHHQHNDDESDEFGDNRLLVSTSQAQNSGVKDSPSAIRQNSRGEKDKSKDGSGEWKGFDIRRGVLSNSSSSSGGGKKRGDARRVRLSSIRASISAASDCLDDQNSSTQNGANVENDRDENDEEGQCRRTLNDDIETEYLESSPLHGASSNGGNINGENNDEMSLEYRDEKKEEHIIKAVFHLMLNRSWKKKLLTTIVVTLVILVVVDLIWFSRLKLFFDKFFEWMKLHPVDGCFAFIGIFVLATNIFLPPTLLTIGSGYIFVGAYGMGMGIYLGTVSCFLGSCLGAILSFVRARYMMRDLIKLFAERYPIVRKFDSALKKKGFRIMLLLRLSAIIPFNALNYIGGVTGVTLSSFVASLIGLLPQIIFTVFIGATAESIYEGRNSENHKIYQNVLLCLGCALGALSIVTICHLAKKELREDEDKTIEDASEISEMDTLAIASNASDGEVTDKQWFEIQT